VVAVVRRVLVLGVLLFWMGGFTFYSAVVVHVGQQVLGSHRDQGFVTRRVTNYLNLAGALALPVLAWDVAAVRDVPGRRRGRWLLWLGLGLTLGVLLWLHPRMDALLDPDRFDILDEKAFTVWHRWYLNVSTVQWACALAYAVLTVLAWRAADRLAGGAASKSA
jgi:hypothetical protein